MKSQIRKPWKGHYLRGRTLLFWLISCVAVSCSSQSVIEEQGSPEEFVENPCDESDVDLTGFIWSETTYPAIGARLEDTADGTVLYLANCTSSNIDIGPLRSRVSGQSVYWHDPIVEGESELNWIYTTIYAAGPVSGGRVIWDLETIIAPGEVEAVQLHNATLSMFIPHGDYRFRIVEWLSDNIIDIGLSISYPEIDELNDVLAVMTQNFEQICRDSDGHPLPRTEIWGFILSQLSEDGVRTTMSSFENLSRSAQNNLLSLLLHRPDLWPAAATTESGTQSLLEFIESSNWPFGIQLHRYISHWLYQEIQRELISSDVFEDRHLRLILGFSDHIDVHTLGLLLDRAQEMERGQAEEVERIFDAIKLYLINRFGFDNDASVIGRLTHIEFGRNHFGERYCFRFGEFQPECFVIDEISYLQQRYERLIENIDEEISDVVDVSSLGECLRFVAEGQTPRDSEYCYVAPVPRRREAENRTMEVLRRPSRGEDASLSDEDCALLERIDRQRRDRRLELQFIQVLPGNKAGA